MAKQSPEPAKPKMVTESLRYPFTPAELRELGDSLAQATLAIAEIEKRKAEANAALTAELKRAAGLVSTIAAKLAARYEMRDYQCYVEFDRPQIGMKQIVRPDNGEVVREEVMTPAEKQWSLGFTDTGTKQ